MSKKNSSAAKVERRAARKAAKARADAATARHTICKVCDRRRQTSLDGICEGCIRAFAGVSKLLGRHTEPEPIVGAEGQDVVVTPPTVASTATAEEIGS